MCIKHEAKAYSPNWTDHPRVELIVYKFKGKPTTFIISTSNTAMKRVVLDSSLTIPIRIPDAVGYSMPPTYLRRKPRGLPILGQQPVKYTHFVNMGDVSPGVKKLLEIPESDTSPLKPIEGYQELLKEGKVYHSDFKRAAKNYLNTPNTSRKDDYFPYTEESVPLVAKNSANLANIVAAARPSKPPSKARSQLKVRPVDAVRPVSKVKLESKTKMKAKAKAKHSIKGQKKKSLSKAKKRTYFKILP